MSFRIFRVYRVPCLQPPQAVLASARMGAGASQERAAGAAEAQGRLSADIRGLRAALEQAVRECRFAPQLQHPHPESFGVF